MNIWLLTHSEEIKKTTGTGTLVKEILNDDCHLMVWSRVEPNAAVLRLSPLDTVLVYPHMTHCTKTVSVANKAIKNVLILDGTWQQARKMYNQSPYLQRFDHYEIQGLRSTYSKRRNQKDTGLCTAEVAIHILMEQQHPAAPALVDRFAEFNQSP